MSNPATSSIPPQARKVQVKPSPSIRKPPTAKPSMLPLHIAELRVPRANPCFSEGVVSQISVWAALFTPEKQPTTNRISTSISAEEAKIMSGMRSAVIRLARSSMILRP